MNKANRLTARVPVLLLVAGVLLAPVSFGANESGYYTVMAVQVDEAGNVEFRLNDELANVWYVCDSEKRLNLSILLTALSTRREVNVYWVSTSGTNRKVKTLRIH